MRIYIESTAIILGWYLIFAYINLSFNPADFTMKIWGSDNETSTLIFQVIFTIASVAVNFILSNTNRDKQ